MKTKLLILSVFIIMTSVFIYVLNSRGGDMKVDLSELKAVSQEKWDALANKKIYFGHQSVGYNILNGIRLLNSEIPLLKINVVEINKINNFPKGVFAHFSVGENFYPKSKIEDFKNTIENKVKGNVDVAFFKFCYIDINEKTDLEGLFNLYCLTMDELEKKFPNIRFLHITVPLTISPNDFKSKIKRLMGYPIKWTDPANIARNRFNDKLIARYGASDKIFDLARFESMLPNGKREFFKIKGERIFTLYNGYASDEGHLNEFGSKIVAKNLIEFLLR